MNALGRHQSQCGSETGNSIIIAILTFHIYLRPKTNERTKKKKVKEGFLLAGGESTLWSVGYYLQYQSFFPVDSLKLPTVGSEVGK